MKFQLEMRRLEMEMEIKSKEKTEERIEVRNKFTYLQEKIHLNMQRKIINV